MKKFLFTCLIIGILGVSASNAAREGTVLDPFDEYEIMPFWSRPQAWGYQGRLSAPPAEDKAMSDEEYRNAQSRVMQIPDLVDGSTPATMSESLARIDQLYFSEGMQFDGATFNGVTKEDLIAFTSSVASLAPGETSYVGLTEEEDDTEMIVKANILAMKMTGQEITAEDMYDQWGIVEELRPSIT